MRACKKSILTKNLFILALTFFSVFVYGQRAIFEKNVNKRAEALEQALNKNGDSLVLKSEKTIQQVDIFNKDYMKTFNINGNEAKIDLSLIPEGRFIVQARLGKKRIVMYLKIHETLENNATKTELATLDETDISSVEIEEAKLSETIASVEESSKKPVSYWVVYESVGGSGSYKTMSLERKDDVAKMISKNKLEINTKIGKNNKLVVYEVYNISKFMRKQLRNPNYFSSSKSKFFNVEPYYTSSNHKDSTQ